MGCPHRSRSASNALVELSTTHLHKQFDALTKQSNDLTAIAQKVANETAEPVKDGITKAFRKAA